MVILLTVRMNCYAELSPSSGYSIDYCVSTINQRCRDLLGLEISCLDWQGRYGRNSFKACHASYDLSLINTGCHRQQPLFDGASAITCLLSLHHQSTCMKFCTVVNLSRWSGRKIFVAECWSMQLTMLSTGANERYELSIAIRLFLAGKDQLTRISS